MIGTAPGEILLRNGLTDLGEGDFKRCDILVEGGRIRRIGTDIEAPGAQIFDCTDLMVVPGMINAHYHSNGNFDRGRWDNLPLEPYGLFAFPRLMAPEMSPREIYVRTMLGAIEQIRTGVTCTVDFLMDPSGFTDESLGPVVQAYRDLGLRVVIALGMNDRPYNETIMLDSKLVDQHLLDMIDAQRPPSWEQWEATARRVVSAFHRPEEGISIGLAPGAPERCTDEFLSGCARLADELDLVIHTHALETRMQAVIAQDRFGKTLPAHLRDLGFLGPRVSLQHGIWLSERDVELVAETGTVVVHNPVSNMKLGSGICPVPLMLKNGVNLALGSDTPSCNDSCNMHETLKIAALLHKLWDVDFEEWVGARDAWRMATRGGALSAGDPARLGHIKDGAWADMVFLDLRSHGFSPLNEEPLQQLVLGGPRQEIDSVMVQGRWVIRNKGLVGVNERSILDEARAIGADLAERRQRTNEIADQLVDAVSAGWRSARDRYDGVSRYADLFGNRPRSKS